MSKKFKISIYVALMLVLFVSLMTNATALTRNYSPVISPYTVKTITPYD
jgi:hypothetical protein